MMIWSKENFAILSGIALLIIVIIVGWMFGDIIRDTARAWQKASSAEEVTKAKENEAKARIIAEEAIKKLDEANDRLIKQMKITEAAEEQLLQSNKISEATKNEYEVEKQKILNTTYHSDNANLNTDDLCARAKSLGISCE